VFKERHDLPVYDADVRVFDVFDADGKQLAIFLHDPYARSNKRGGAWMNAYVGQNKLLGTHPVIANHLNIPKPAAGEPTLLTYDEVRTMFHEFGHALHGMFSNVKYPRFSGTRVPRDYVEFPFVPPRYRTTYFSHVFSGGYSAGYYGYLWAEKLDADTVEWFKEHGGLTRKNGDHFRQMLLSRGGTMDAMDMYRNFRGRDAK